MKKLYSTLLFFIVTFFISAQNQEGNAAYNKEVETVNENLTDKSSLTARPIAINTSPSGTSTEVGITEGALNVSLNGSASYTIPILVPPGINGVEPQISINYNSQRGLGGTAAKGWDIGGVSSITRIPATKFHDLKIDPVDFNSLDRFALDGQRLIVKNGSSAYGGDGTVYETEYFSNIKVTSYGVHPSGANYGPLYFLVEYPNGTKAYFGNSTDSRSVMDWSITAIDNPQGIRISYTYINSNNSLYIDSIKYGGLTPSTPINEIKFVYAPKIVAEDSYVGGVNIKRDKNLTNINVSGNGIGFRNYVFDNKDQIKTVIEKNGDNTKSYNPIIFDYDYSSASTISYKNGNNRLDVGNILSTNASTVSGDFDGDGNMDFILYPTTGSSAKAKYWVYADTNPSTPYSMSITHNVGNFQDIFPATYLDSGNRLVSTQGWTVVKEDSFTTYYLNSTWGVLQNDQKMYTFPKFILRYFYPCDLDDPVSRVANSDSGAKTATTTKEGYIEKDVPKIYISGDFNGDGLTDAVVIEKSVTYTMSLDCTRTISQTSTGGTSYFVNLDKRITTNFVNHSGNLRTTNNSKFMVADFNDDGKSDIYVFDTGSVKVYSLNDNNQFYLLFQTTINDPNIILDRPILMGDYNGDGKTDFMVPKAFDSANWYKYMSTGSSFVKEEKTGLIFKQNDSFNTFNYFAIDFNNDSKTDLICEKSFENTTRTQGSLTINCYISENGSFSPVPGSSLATSPLQAGVNIYALPVYLPMYRQTLNNGYINTVLQVAFLNQDKIHFFSAESDLIKDNLLTNIRTGNGVEQAVTYIPLNSNYKNTYNSIYTSSVNTASYPYVDIKINPSLYVVSKIEQKSKDTYKKRWFGYYGAVSNVEGLGFVGFRAVTQTNWHDDNAMIFTDIYKNDIDLRAANIESITVPYLSYPYEGISPTNFIAKSISAYSNTIENPLQGNKVFKLKTTNIKQFNTLNGTNTEIKDIIYDDYNNITTSTTVSGEVSAPVVKTEKTDISYETPKTSPLYILGRPLTKTQSVTSDGHTMAMTEKYTYNAQELLSTTERNALGTPAITEKNDYDSYGNITQKTIIPTLPMLPRVTKYAYDTTKRFVNTITDNDNLVTSFEYYSNGLLKKETDPYSLSRSYTYDSWFKNLTITDDLLNNVISNVYSRSIEKTIVTTTVSAPGLDTSVTEETFDDLGRKIKSGAKDLNGNFSYVSYLHDIYDRNYKVSEPYSGTSPSQWNEVKFDDYGRNTQSILFNGRNTSISYPPSSLKSIMTDGSKSKTTIQNAAGNTTSTDETLGGIISYNYFANGALRKTSYNGVAINMEQDGWGQKTKLIDPSAGTYNYNYNDLGELMTETIDGTGIITSIFRDNSGRSTKKTIVGPTTHIEINYTYEGNLPLTIEYVDLNEPTGTNKTKTTITYDTYKRISSIVEDKTGVSKFTTTYTYDNLNRILTETKLAEIGGRSSSVKTKNVYKNGSLHQIEDFETNKILWQTNTLNAKGQIKESETGNGIKTTNTYDPSVGYLSSIQYDKTTTPTSNILTLTTNFDKNTDYLSNRINSAFGDYTETFKYDDIGRLKDFTNRLGNLETQTYDVSGKITGNNLGTYSYDAAKPYQNTSINLTPEATGYYANREGIFNDSMENRTGWSRQAYNPQCISFDNTVAHTGKNSLKINTAGLPGSYVQSDVSIPINNITDTEYTFSGWIYSDGPASGLTMFMLKEGETFYYTNYKSSNTNVINQWHHINETFLVPANIRNISLRLDNLESGNVWFDDVEIRKTSDPTSIVRHLNVTYNAFKSPIQIEETNVDKISFTYNDDNQRSTMYYGGFQNEKLERPLRKHYSADGTMEVKENRLTNTFEFVTYIGGDGYSAPIVSKSDGINLPNYLYLHRDYQGTILAITNSNGDLIEKRLFDAWGSIIKVQDGAGNTLNGLTVLERGYTGHEHLQSVGLINMNARLYDPMIHRFLQPDNFIQDPANTQNYNQYGYVLNNPLLYIDPSGNKSEPTRDCIDCGLSNTDQTFIGAAIGTLVTNWDSWRVKDWANRNINGHKFSEWWKSKVSFKNFFGGGHDNSPPPPPPNMSSYVNLSANNFSFIAPVPLPNSNGLSKNQWANLPWYERIITDRPGVIGGNGGLAFVTGEAEVLLFAKGGEKAYEVYHLVNKETQAIEYIGKTGQGMLKRFEQHLLDPTKEAWINNVEPVLFKGGLTRYGAKYYEQTEIMTYKLEKLYNKINAVAEKYWIKYRIR